MKAKGTSSKIGPSTFPEIFILFPKRLLAKPWIFIALGITFLFLQFGTGDHPSAEKYVPPKYLLPFIEPNQTRWRNTIKLPLRMTNLSSPSIPPMAKMVILVPLNAYLDTRRQEIRTSWGHSNNSEAIRSGLVVVIFLVTQNSFTDYQIREENARFHDILVVRGEDTYKALVYKLLSAFKWFTGFHPILDIAKVDSDVVVDVDKMYRAVNKEIHHPRFAMGLVWKNVEPIRDPFDPWYIPASIYRDKYLPPYTNGPCYVLSSSAVKAILLEAPSCSVFEVEDAFFTGVLGSRAGVSVLKLEGVYWRAPEKQLCDERGNPTVIAYPAHGTKMGIKVEYERMKTIRCMTDWEKWFD